MGQFQKGVPRPAGAGRKKGTPNKKTLARVDSYLIEQGINPVQRAIEAIKFLDPKDEFRAWMDIIAYCQAKPKELPDDRHDDESDEELLSQFENVTDAVLLEFVKKQDEAP